MLTLFERRKTQAFFGLVQGEEKVPTANKRVVVVVVGGGRGAECGVGWGEDEDEGVVASFLPFF